MFQGVLVALVLYPVCKLFELKKKEKIDNWEILVIAVVPGIVVWGVKVFVSIMELPVWVAFAGNLAYIFVPYFILTQQYKYEKKQALIYTSYVVLAFILVRVFLILAVYLLD